MYRVQPPLKKNKVKKIFKIKFPTLQVIWLFWGKKPQKYTF